MTGKLIDEPPLLVLPSLARELGLERAIVLQQLHYAGRRSEEGWVERSSADWSRALGSTIAARSFERIWPALVTAGWVEARPTVGRPTAYRVTPRTERGVGPAASVGSPPAASGGSLSREEKREKTASPKAPSPEPDGFTDWLGYHVLEAGKRNFSLSMPREGTSYRKSLAVSYAAIVGEGYSVEEIKLASVGVLTDPQMREGGWIKPENVLRKTKFGGKVDRGRAVIDSGKADPAEKYGHLDG